MEKLKSMLKFGAILSDSDVDYIASKFKNKPIKATEYFSEIGAISNHMGFVEQGIIRVYKPDSAGNEITKYFFRENQFFADLESYYSATPSTEAFQAVVDSEVYAIHKLVVEKLCEEVPNFFIFLKSVAEAALLNKIKDTDFLNFGDAKTKYLEFIRRYATLAQQVPQQYIASYLKITPQSLSRIRRELGSRR